jgi:mannose/cellobiose epimerase-like protein (N-acyl-D-glucosamine 2-epimerase family)
MLHSAFKRVGALAENALHTFIEEETGTINELVDHACRQVIRQRGTPRDL